MLMFFGFQKYNTVPKIVKILIYWKTPQKSIFFFFDLSQKNNNNCVSVYIKYTSDLLSWHALPFFQ